MALTLSDTDRIYVQNKTGIGDDETILDNDYLDNLYTRSFGNLNLTIGEAWESIASDQAKLVTYSNGLQSEDLSDLFDHCMQMASYYRDKGNANNQFVNVGLKSFPNKYKDRPWTELRYGRSLRGRGRWNWG